MVLLGISSCWNYWEYSILSGKQYISIEHILIVISYSATLWLKNLKISASHLDSILFFQVMLQKHNRIMSFSIYVCVLAVADTVSLTIGKRLYFSMF